MWEYSKERVSMWMNIGTTLFIFAIGFTVYWAIKGRSEKFHKSKFGKIAIALFVLSIGAGMLDPSTSSSDGSSSTTQSQESHKSSSSTVKASSVKKAKAESSSKRKAELSSENQSLKKQVKIQRKKNEKLNYQELQSYLSKLSTKYHGAIDNAYYSKADSATVIILDSDILSMSDNQLKAAVRGAWNIGQNAAEKYSPLPDSVNANYITVKDSTGNNLAHTSMFGSFKYDGE